MKEEKRKNALKGSGEYKKDHQKQGGSMIE